MRTAFGLLMTAALLAPRAASADTILHLSATASINVIPDVLAAQLTANDDAPTAAAAQAGVNTMVAMAMAAAKGVTASTTAYSVWHETTPKDVWHASQGVALRSKDGGGLLTLVGALQQDGLAVGDLGWQLSPALSEKTYEQAITRAINLLAARARRVAALLHLTMMDFRSVTVGEDTGDQPRPLGMMRMMAEAPAAPPNARADAVTVSATVSGNARLMSVQP